MVKTRSHCAVTTAARSLISVLKTFKGLLSQEFVSHECDTSELGPSRFATTDVHRIGILDVRLYNTDRCASPRDLDTDFKVSVTSA